MATTRQIQANRANAKRSTGPVTEAGKQASSQNATRHGLLSGCLVLKSESREKWEELLASLVTEFQPSTPNELILVEIMAAARWRQVRTCMLQTVTLENQTSDLDPEEGSDTALAAMAFGKSADSSQALHLLQRYETALDRQYSRALNNLRKCRADKTLHTPNTHQAAEESTATPPSAAQPDPPPRQPTTPPGNKTLRLQKEANLPASRPVSSKVVRPDVLAACRFRSRMNREYRILRLRKPLRGAHKCETYAEPLPLTVSLYGDQARQSRRAWVL
jgi:hypothetical protein